ncbi:uncharacterized protein [Nicotiana sylvestris]|uniref:uncharacterized protein n=1 Tax=Nicotiana sylvestris TaxID=4096 RepID=UPI00388C7080
MVLAKGTNVKVSKRKQHDGSRDAPEVADLLWRMDKYFEVVKEDEEVVKVHNASMYLTKVAALWWRRKCADMEKGLCKIEKRKQFKKEMKKQFYPMNVVYEARLKLRELRQTATIWEYVSESTTLMLQIPSLSEKDSLFCFMDELQNWIKRELRRHQVAGVDEAIAVAESHLNFKMEPAKSKEGNAEKGGGDHNKENGKGIAEIYKGNGKGS